jgi:uncharacterized protein YcfL
MKTSKALIPLLIGILLTLAGCQSPTNPRAGQQGEVDIRSHSLQGMEIVGIFNPDGTVNTTPQAGQTYGRRDFYVDSVRALPTDAGFSRVQVGVTSRSRTRINLQYRFAWFDAAGMEIAPGTGGWNSISLAPAENATFTGVARSENATEFRIFVRKLDQRR